MSSVKMYVLVQTTWFHFFMPGKGPKPQKTQFLSTEISPINLPLKQVLRMIFLKRQE